MNDSPRWVPHDYQATAVSFELSRKRGALFLDPGLGKTSISLAVFKTLLAAGDIKGVLLVAPLRVVYSVWPKEIKKWCNFNHLTCTILHEGTKDTIYNKSDIYLINPEGLPWLYETLAKHMSSGGECPFNTLCVDESTKFKNHQSKRFKLLKDMLPLFKRRYIMTGTPSPKSYVDLWAQIYLLDEGASLGKNFYLFRNKYFKSDDWNAYAWKLKDDGKEMIERAISHLVLDMSAHDNLNMPDLITNNIICKLPEKVMKKYKKMEKEFFLEIDGNEINAQQAAQASMKCHQIANGMVYEDYPEDLDEAGRREFAKTRKSIKVHTAKIEALKELIDELNGKPLLVAYHYKHDLQAIQDALGGDIPYIGSGVSPSVTDKTVDDWNAGKIQVLLGHPVSMAHGLNLQSSGNDICWFSQTWSLEDDEQFNARIYRQGVKGAVRVHRLVAEGTIDEAMILRLGERSKDQKDLRDALRRYRLKGL